MRTEIKRALDDCWQLFVDGRTDESDAKLSEAIALASGDEEKREVGRYVHERIVKRKGEKRDDVSVESVLDGVKDAINMAYLSKHYFGHSAPWLAQRLNGNLVNGKPAAFTTEDLQMMASALKDLSQRLAAASYLIRERL